jgi:hypothetical protein
MLTRGKRQSIAEDALRLVSEVFSQTFDVEQLRKATSLRTLNTSLYATETAEERAQRKQRVVHIETDRILREIRDVLRGFVREPHLRFPAPQLFGACGEHATVRMDWCGENSCLLLFDEGRLGYMTSPEMPWETVDAFMNYSKAKGLKFPWNWHAPLPRSRIIELD